MINVTLSGEVDADGISEVWWKDKRGVDHRIFTNANFLFFTGFAQFENETNRFHTFLMITRRPPYADPGDEWRPTKGDFNKGIEYYAVEPKDATDADYTTLEAMLAYYAEHSADMKTTYENRQLLASCPQGLPRSTSAERAAPRDVLPGKSNERIKAMKRKCRLFLFFAFALVVFAVGTQTDTSTPAEKTATATTATATTPASTGESATPAASTTATATPAVSTARHADLAE